MRKLLLMLVLLGGCGDDDGDAEPSNGGVDAGMHAAADAGEQAEPVDAGALHDAAADPAPTQGGPAIDPLQCHILCTSNDASGCANAPDHMTCFDACELSVEHCPELVAPLMDCLGALPMFTCDDDGNVASASCDAELTAVQDCVAANAGS